MKTFKDFLKEEDGMGTVEVILIIVENYTSTLPCIWCVLCSFFIWADSFSCPGLMNEKRIITMRIH